MANKDKPKAPASRVLNQTKAKAESAERWHIRLNLKRVHPFLRNEFRPLKASELRSVKVFNELFPDEKQVQLYKLKAIYEFQR